MECKNVVMNNMENSIEKKSSCNAVSLLQGDDIFFNKLLTKDDSSIGFSSRIYYRSSEGHVPFKWESQPGTPLNLPVHNLLPPLSPPPSALHGSILARRPCTTNYNQTKVSSWSWVLFWKKSKQTKRSKRETGESSPDITNMGRIENFEFWSSDFDSMSSPYHSSSSSSSSYFDGYSSPSPTMRSQKTTVNSDRKSRFEGLDRGFICSPWNFAGVAVCAPKGV
ncbi:hypothetical protein BVC80_8709g9 [Macleaya cordata]|uniref:Uncharacterized protein n=1 Tax=Macleaya cordata TaxID=56857 RepID=A0A200R8D5_MACCD|nr:hypothetical protein BVC80_8709g9 [Macleaya cordata]